MSKERQLQELAQLTEIVFVARSAELQPVLAREKMLRERYAELDEQRRKALSSPVEEIEHRLTGADVVYQIWLGRQLSSINQELARLMVEKERHKDGVKVAYGKRDVATRLAQQAARIRRLDGQGS